MTMIKWLLIIIGVCIGAFFPIMEYILLPGLEGGPIYPDESSLWEELSSISIGTLPFFAILIVTTTFGGVVGFGVYRLVLWGHGK